jgi:hypothetical protein
LPRHTLSNFDEKVPTSESSKSDERRYPFVGIIKNRKVQPQIMSNLEIGRRYQLKISYITNLRNLAYTFKQL